MSGTDQAERTKKLINAPEDLIPEMVEGMLAAYPDLLCLEGETGRAITARDGPRDGKVGIVVGGGSGHEPAFAGYVGRGLADVAAVGNVFASPSPSQIEEAAIAADGGSGVLFLFGNYTGDVMNFSMAAQRCLQAGIPARCFAVTDDIASAPADRVVERRGIAGDFFVFKIAGAAADEGMDLNHVEAMARRANDATRSFGVALSACSMPQTAVPNFDVAAGMMEVGMGLHGEPGMHSLPVEAADDVIDRLLAPIVEELSLTHASKVAVLLNGLGATSQLELFILYRRVAAELGRMGVTIDHRWVGEYATSLEMAGASLTIMRLDDDLARLLAHPCRTPALTVGTAQTAPSTQRRHTTHKRMTRDVASVDRSTLAVDGPITPEMFNTMLRSIAARIDANRDWLSKLDGVIGDGDHGITMGIGWRAIEGVLDAQTDDDTITLMCHRSADAFLDAVGASSGPLYATALMRAGDAVSDRLNLNAEALVGWIEGISNGIVERGGAEPGQKTMVDAWIPAAQAARTTLLANGDVAACLQAARDGAKAGMDATADMRSSKGRSAKLGDRSIGHVDPGAASAWVMLDAMVDALEV
ncbi:MAG: dihydroxyacetone kinase subunit DhaL [Pseudomonadota bacterium]